MFTKSEIYELFKGMGTGFVPSRTGKSPFALVGRGGHVGNRQMRRSELAHQKGDHRNKGGLMIVQNGARFESRVQVVPGKFKTEKKGRKKVQVWIPERRIVHWDAK